MDSEKRELVELVAATVAAAMMERKPTVWEKARGALVNVTLSGLGAAVAVVLGFWFAEMRETARQADKKSDTAIETAARNEKTVAVVTQLRALLTSQEGSITVLRDEVARLRTMVAAAPEAAPVTADDFEKSREKLRSREDKEIYRIQQQTIPRE